MSYEFSGYDVLDLITNDTHVLNAVQDQRNGGVLRKDNCFLRLCAYAPLKPLLVLLSWAPDFGLR